MLSQEISEKQEIATATETKIDQVRDGYKPVCHFIISLKNIIETYLYGFNKVNNATYRNVCFSLLYKNIGFSVKYFLVLLANTVI